MSMRRRNLVMHACMRCNGTDTFCSNTLVAPLYFVTFTIIASMVALNLVRRFLPGPPSPSASTDLIVLLLLFSALYAKCPYYVVIYMQNVLSIAYVVCLYASVFIMYYSYYYHYVPHVLSTRLALRGCWNNEDYVVELYMQSVLVMQCFICKVSLLF